jgi:hypothetical protein
VDVRPNWRAAAFAAEPLVVSSLAVVVMTYARMGAAGRGLLVSPLPARLLQHLPVLVLADLLATLLDY